MSRLVEYIIQNYSRIQVLQDNAYGLTEIVHGQDGGIYVRKILPDPNEAAKALKKLKHKNIVRILQVATDTSHTYILEEYVDGKNLQTLLNEQGPFSEKQAVEIIEQLCDGLIYLHQNKVIHRDIKPSNIILQSSGVIKLIDFGAARQATNNAEHDTQILGTEGFAPPEQYGFGATDQRSDIYALGKTLKALLGENYHGYLVNAITSCTSFAPDSRPSNVMQVKQLLKFPASKAKIMLLSLLCLSLAAGAWLMYSSKTSNPNASKPAKALEKTSSLAENKQDSSATSINDPSKDKALEKTLSKDETKTTNATAAIFKDKAKAKNTTAAVSKDEANTTNAKVSISKTDYAKPISQIPNTQEAKQIEAGSNTEQRQASITAVPKSINQSTKQQTYSQQNLPQEPKDSVQNKNIQDNVNLSYWDKLNRVTATLKISNTNLSVDKAASSKKQIILKPEIAPPSITITNTSDYDLDGFYISIKLGDIGILAKNTNALQGDFFVAYVYYASYSINETLTLRVSGNLKAHQSLTIPIDGDIKWYQLGPNPIIYANVRPNQLYKVLDNKTSKFTIR